MPYTAAHKSKTRARIVECARILFNRHGFDNVTIDMVMGDAKLTRGGFYNHFKSKEELFAAAVSSFLMGRGAAWRAEAGIDPTVQRQQQGGRLQGGIGVQVVERAHAEIRSAASRAAPASISTCLANTSKPLPPLPSDPPA